MKENKKKYAKIGSAGVLAFAIWTYLIQNVDVQAIGVNGTNVGFATFNGWFHDLTGVHMAIYHITDWLGLIPIFVCMVLAGVGFIQLVSRKSLFKVDHDIVLLGIYYVIVIMGYLVFEMIPINYRPILIEGVMEASYPSSTTLLVLSVMPTLVFQVKRRAKKGVIQKGISFFTILFSMFMVIGRLISGVHWFTDIVGSVMLSIGLYNLYKAAVFMYQKEEN